MATPVKQGRRERHEKALDAAEVAVTP